MANWTLTRKDTSDPLELPGDMRWTDEFDWQALAQSNVQYSLGGEWIWLPRATLLTLAAWADVPELEMTLTTPDGRSYNTCFARPALSNTTPVNYASPEDGTAQYEAVQVHLQTI